MRIFTLPLSIFFIALFGVAANANTCATAVLVNSQESYETATFTGNLLGAGASTPVQCAGPGGRADRWYRFTAVASTHGVRATGDGDLNLALEIFASCGGAQLACQNSAGPGGQEFFLLSGLTVGTTYYFRVYDAGATPAVSTTFSAAVVHVPFVELRSSDCGDLNFTTNDLIRSTLPSNTTNLTNYQWRFVELEAPFNTYIITAPNGANPNFLIRWFPQAEYGRNYEVSVRVRSLFPEFGDFGNACTIGLQDQVLSTALQQQYNGGTYTFCDIVGANPVSLATQYRWTFLNLDNSVQTEVFGLGSSRLLQLSRVPSLQLNRTYVVGAFATVAGQESPGGTLRFLFTNSTVPNTGINSALYPCGQTYPISTFLQATEVCNAAAYTWRFTNLSTSQPTIFYTRTDGSRFISLYLVPGLNVGDTYAVDVRATQGGLVGSYSTVCNITIGESQAPSGLMADSDDSEMLDQFSTLPNSNPQWSMSVLPITNDNSSYKVTLINDGDIRGVDMALFDLNGRLIDQKSTVLGIDATVTWELTGLARGVYLVKSMDDTHSETKKIVVL